MSEPTNPDIALLQQCLDALDIEDIERGPMRASWNILRSKLRDRIGPTSYTNQDAYNLLDQAESIILESQPGETCTHIQWKNLISNWCAKKEALNPSGIPLGGMTGVETRTTRYKAEDGRERAVVLWTDYEWLLKEAKRTPNSATAPEPNPHFDEKRRLQRDQPGRAPGANRRPGRRRG